MWHCAQPVPDKRNCMIYLAEIHAPCLKACIENSLTINAGDDNKPKFSTKRRKIMEYEVYLPTEKEENVDYYLEFDEELDFE